MADHRWRGVAVTGGLAGIAAAVLVVVHPGSARTSVSTPRVSHTGCVSDPAVTTEPLCVHTARVIPRRRPPFRPLGTVVSSSALFGNRVYRNAEEGVALANGDNAQYPVLTTDGGRVWRIDGPPLHVDAADGPEGVGWVGIVGPRTFFAYGSSVVDVTTDRGRTWRETFLGEGVAAVVPGPGTGLVAYVEQSVSNRHLNPAMTWEYVSRDGGRHWRYSTDFAGIPG